MNATPSDAARTSSDAIDTLENGAVTVYPRPGAVDQPRSGCAQVKLLTSQDLLEHGTLMSAFETGQRVRIAAVPADILPWVDTGSVVRRLLAHDLMTGRDRDTDTWLVRFDLMHFERAIPAADLTRLD